MRMIILALGLAVSLIWASAPVQAQQDDIRDVISSQIDAFKVDDFETAFTFAAPSIQNLFQTPENFGRMVSNGYPMVWRPADVTYLDLRIEDGAGVFQDVQIVDGNGDVHLLEYRMQQIGERWRISGVRLLEAPGVAA